MLSPVFAVVQVFPLQVLVGMAFHAIGQISMKLRLKILTTVAQHRYQMISISN